jgi:hypothetical protein
MYSEFTPGLALPKTGSGEYYVGTFYETTPRAKNPQQGVRPTSKAQVHGKRHCQHQPVDQNDEIVHYQDSRL